MWYVYNRKFFYFITKYCTKKIRNLSENNKVSLVVDKYPRERESDIEGVCICGTAEILERGKEYRDVISLIEEKYPNCKKYHPYDEDKIPIIKIKPNGISNW